MKNFSLHLLAEQVGRCSSLSLSLALSHRFCLSLRAKPLKAALIAVMSGTVTSLKIACNAILPFQVQHRFVPLSSSPEGDLGSGYTPLCSETKRLTCFAMRSCSCQSGSPAASIQPRQVLEKRAPVPAQQQIHHLDSVTPDTRRYAISSQFFVVDICWAGVASLGYVQLRRPSLRGMVGRTPDWMVCVCATTSVNTAGHSCARSWQRLQMTDHDHDCV